MSTTGAIPDATPTEPSARGLISPACAALADIKLAHTVFALPFAVLGAFIAAPRTEAGSIAWPMFAGQLALVVVCMVFARTWAMLVNRLADHRFDAENPRTARRAIPSGRLGVGQGWALALGSAALFCAGASLFSAFYANSWPALLAIPALLWIALYSFTKRFTALCHVFLGGALGASPIAAAIAVNPHAMFASDSSVRPIVVHIALFVVLWVAGFDVAYALADIDFDRRTGLRSIPARLGVRGALWVSRVMHVLAFGSLVIVALHSGRPPIFSAAVVLTGCLLIFEHVVLAKRGLAGLPLAFFTLNGVISVTLALAGITDILLG